MSSEEATALQTYNPGQLMRQATDVAGVCREIVMRTAQTIQGRKFVRVEGWQAISMAHGCMLSIERVSEDDAGNISAIASVRRISDGAKLGEAEGFVGSDENTWNKRPRYARRAMAQTRAMSRAARSAFAHVVVLIDSNLSTTPAEEMGGDDDYQEPRRVQSVEVKRADAEPAHELADDAAFVKAVHTAAMARGITPAEADAGLATTKANLQNPADYNGVVWRLKLIGGINAGKADKWKAPQVPAAPSQPAPDDAAQPAPADEPDVPQQDERPDYTAADLAVMSDHVFATLIWNAADDAALAEPQVKHGVMKFANAKGKSTKSLTGPDKLELFKAVEAKAFDWSTGAVREHATA